MHADAQAAGVLLDGGGWIGEFVESGVEGGATLKAASVRNVRSSMRRSLVALSLKVAQGCPQDAWTCSMSHGAGCIPSASRDGRPYRPPLSLEGKEKHTAQHTVWGEPGTGTAPLPVALHGASMRAAQRAGAQRTATRGAAGTCATCRARFHSPVRTKRSTSTRKMASSGSKPAWYSRRVASSAPSTFCRPGAPQHR